MKKNLIILFLVLAGGLSFAQSDPWIAPTSNKHTILIAQDIYTKPLIIGKDTILQSGDALGVFYRNSEGIEYCAGGIFWMQSDSNFYAYGRDSANGAGFDSNDVFYYKIWQKNKNCQIKNVTVTYQINALFKDGFYKTGNVSRITSLSAELKDVKYQNFNICKNAGIINILNADSANIYFSSAPGLAINTLTGEIDAGNSNPGVYTINIKSNYCLVSDYTMVRIISEPTLNLGTDTAVCRIPYIINPLVSFASYQWSDHSTNPTLAVSKSGIYSLEVTDTLGCKASDSMAVVINGIDLSMLNLGNDTTICQIPYILKTPATFASYHWSDNSSNSTIEVNKSGVYSLEATNTYGCKAEDTIKITIKCDTNTEYPVFSPNNDGKDDEYYINMTGKVKIYDKNGILKAEFNAPYLWDGTDTHGATLPMGAYLITDENGNYINITIVR